MWGDARRRLQVAAVLSSTSLSAVAFALLHEPHRSFDVKVYRGAVDSWAHGGDLYSFGLGARHLGFTYPPFAALCFLPMLLLPLAAVIVLNQLAVIASVALLLRVVVARLPSVSHLGPWLLAAVLTPPVLLLQPVRDTVTFGQINIGLAALVTLDLLLIERGSRLGGVGAGLATALKLTPGLFLVLYLLTGPRPTFRTSVLSFLAATGLAAVVAPYTSWSFWTSTLFDSSRVGSYDSASNQSFAGVLARLTNSGQVPGAWLPLIVVISAAALWSARRLFRAGAHLPAFTAVGLTAAVASPISWTHHLWWVVPALLLLLDQGLQRRSWWRVSLVAVLAAVLASGLPDTMRATSGHHLDSAMTVLGENVYGVTVIVLLVLVCALPSSWPERVAPRVPELV